jgi:hypothetical protein
MLRVLHECARERRSGCDLNSRLVKEILYGRQRGLSTAQRVTLCRSAARLIANGLIAEEEPGTRYFRRTRCFRLTDKGRAWLAAHPAALEPAEPQGPPQERRGPTLSEARQMLACCERGVRSAVEVIHDDAAILGEHLDGIRTGELWKYDHPDWSWSDYLTHRSDELLADAASAQAALAQLLDAVEKQKGK